MYNGFMNYYYMRQPTHRTIRQTILVMVIAGLGVIVTRALLFSFKRGDRLAFLNLMIYGLWPMAQGHDRREKPAHMLAGRRQRRDTRDATL